MKLHPDVKAITRFTDPMNPDMLTLADLRKPPYSLWLKFIEPRIVTMGTEKEACWCWDIKNRNHDPSKWYPQAWVSFRPEVENPVYQNVNVRRFIAQMFWHFPEHFSVYRNKDICPNYNCVRPTHLIIAPHNDGRAKFGKS